MTRTTTAATVATLALMVSLPAFSQGRRPRINGPEARRATVLVEKAGDSLSFNGCTTARTCATDPVEPSPGQTVHTVVWDVRIDGESVDSVTVSFKDGATPCYNVRRGKFRDEVNVIGRRVNRRNGFARCRIKTRGWTENSDGNRIRALDREEFPYTIKVVTDANTYEVDPIVIVRGGG